MTRPDPPRLIDCFQRWYTSYLPGLPAGRSAQPRPSEVKSAVRDLQAYLKHELAAYPERLSAVNDVLASTVVRTLNAIRTSGTGARSDDYRHDDHQDKGLPSWIPFVGGSSPGRSQPVATVTIDAYELFEGVRVALEALDRVFELARPAPPERVPVPWAGDPRLLRCFQDLLEPLSRQSPKLALGRLNDLRSLLGARDIDVLDFTPERSDLFEQVPDPLARQPQTIRPALVGRGPDGKRVRGLVHLPSEDGTARSPGAGEVNPTAEADFVAGVDGAARADSAEGMEDRDAEGTARPAEAEDRDGRING